MIDKLAGLPTQIRQLEKRLKEMDGSKVKPSALKEITDTIQNLKNLLKEKMDKREERKKAKEQAAASVPEVEKEAIAVPNAADVGAVSQNAPAPAAAPGAPAATSDDQKVSCPLCGGMTFNDNASYQQHMAYTHASDIMPTSPGQKQDNLVAAVEAPVEKESKFKLDAEVKPIRGGDSKGKVMRWDGKPNDHVYVMWESGPLKDRDGFGGYYPDDLELMQAEPVEATMPPMEKPACADCISMKEKHGDLRTNYEGLLKDLKEERDTHYTQGNSKWVERLDQKIRDLEKSIEEKFPKESAKACPTCGEPHKSDPSGPGVVDLPMEKHNPADMVGLPTKEGGAQNAKDLTIMDHTPPRANSGPDAGGTDSHDEFQDEWAMPAGIELQSKLPKAQQKELDGLVQKAVYGYQINIMDMSKVYQAGEAAFISGQDVTAAVHAFLDSMVAAGKAMKTADQKAPITAPTKLLVFKREFLATPLKDQEKFGGYEISQNGKKLFKINSSNSQPMTREQIEFCAQIELTRGLKQAKLTEKITFLEAGSMVYILAADKPQKRIKFASMEHGIRGWAPVSKFAFLAKESEMRKHKDHIDNTFGHNGKEILVDCPNGSGNLVWLPINELLPIQAPPATPESLNPDLGMESAKECPDCHGTFEGAEGQTCPTCGRFAVQKEAAGGGLWQSSILPILENKFSEVSRLMGYATGNDDNVYGKYSILSEFGSPAAEDNEVYVGIKASLTNKGDIIVKLIGTKGETLSASRIAATPSAVDALDPNKLADTLGLALNRSLGIPDDPDDMDLSHLDASKKEALRPALPPQILNRRQEVNASGCDQCAASMINGVFCHETGCPNARKERGQEDIDVEAENKWPLCSVEGCNNKADSVGADDSKRYCYTHSWGHKQKMKEAALDKVATVVHREDGWHVLSEKGKNLGGPYKSKEEAVKRLRQVEYFKHNGAFRPFSKQVYAEVMADPYQAITEHITDMKVRMDQVNEKLQNAPAIKTAIVTDETIEETTTNDPSLANPSLTPIPPPVPGFQNIQPTDNDNLEIPVPMPTSPPPPGQKWVYNDVDSAYVLMPDMTDPSKLV